MFNVEKIILSDSIRSSTNFTLINGNKILFFMKTFDNLKFENNIYFMHLLSSGIMSSLFRSFIVYRYYLKF